MATLFFPECVPLIKGIVFIALERIYLSKNIFAGKKNPFFLLAIYYQRIIKEIFIYHLWVKE